MLLITKIGTVIDESATNFPAMYHASTIIPKNTEGEINYVSENIATNNETMNASLMLIISKII
jgi:hypothetical protein